VHQLGHEIRSYFPKPRGGTNPRSDLEIYMIEAVRLIPKNGDLTIKLFGELTALLSLAEEGKRKHPRADAPGVQVTLVAGAGLVQAPTITRHV